MGLFSAVSSIFSAKNDRKHLRNGRDAQLLGQDESLGAYEEGADRSATAVNAYELMGQKYQQQMGEDAMEFQNPYAQQGGMGLAGLDRLINDRGSVLSDYYAGEEFAAQEEQQQRQALKNASVTGLRGGNTQEAMASIAPMLGQNYLNQSYDRYSDAANMGFNAANNMSNISLGMGDDYANSKRRIGESQVARHGDKANARANKAMNVGDIQSGYSSNRAAINNRTLGSLAGYADSKTEGLQSKLGI
ncbi:MAG: hypothetical protein V3R25_06145 [Nitrosomonadaceae bacterium]